MQNPWNEDLDSSVSRSVEEILIFKKQFENISREDEVLFEKTINFAKDLEKVAYAFQNDEEL